MSDAVNHPAHYRSDTIEALNVIDAWELNFNLGNAVKYISRAGLKNKDKIQDLQKAIFYINHEIKTIQKNSENKS